MINFIPAFSRIKEHNAEIQLLGKIKVNCHIVASSEEITQRKKNNRFKGGSTLVVKRKRI